MKVKIILILQYCYCKLAAHAGRF